MTSTETCAQTRIAERLPRSLTAALASPFTRVASLVKRRRQIQKSQAVLNTVSDRMLADIGLQRARRGPEVANSALRARF